MRHDVLVVIAFIDHGFEYLHLLPGYKRAVQAANEFLSLSGEHTTANDFNPARLLRLRISSEVWFYKHDAKYLQGGVVSNFTTIIRYVHITNKSQEPHEAYGEAS